MDGQETTTAVIGHWQTKLGEHSLVLLDILSNLLIPYMMVGPFAKTLLEVTNRLGIICTVMSVTRDNASPNDMVLEEFEAVVATQWGQMEKDRLPF
jgi:hypothetical protein